MLVYCLTELVCSVSIVAILSMTIIIMRKRVIVANRPFFLGSLCHFWCHWKLIYTFVYIRKCLL